MDSQVWDPLLQTTRRALLFLSLCSYIGSFNGNFQNKFYPKYYRESFFQPLVPLSLSCFHQRRGMTCLSWGSWRKVTACACLSSGCCWLPSRPQQEHLLQSASASRLYEALQRPFLQGFSLSPLTLGYLNLKGYDPPIPLICITSKGLTFLSYQSRWHPKQDVI